MKIVFGIALVTISLIGLAKAQQRAESTTDSRVRQDSCQIPTALRLLWKIREKWLP